MALDFLLGACGNPGHTPFLPDAQYAQLSALGVQVLFPTPSPAPSLMDACAPPTLNVTAPPTAQFVSVGNGTQVRLQLLDSIGICIGALTAWPLHACCAQTDYVFQAMLLPTYQTYPWPRDVSSIPQEASRSAAPRLLYPSPACALRMCAAQACHNHACIIIARNALDAPLRGTTRSVRARVLYQPQAPSNCYLRPRQGAPAHTLLLPSYGSLKGVLARMHCSPPPTFQQLHKNGIHFGP